MQLDISMKLSEVQPGNRLFTGTNREGVPLTFLVRYTGKDGHATHPVVSTP